MSLDLFVLVVLPAALIAADYLNGLRLFRHMRERYPALWSTLGESTLDASNYASSRLKLTRYIWAGKFFALRDATLTLHALLAISIQVALLSCLAFAVFHAAA